MSDIRAVFADQASGCIAMGSPFMGRLMELVAQRLERGTPIADYLFDWPGNPAIAADNAPLRFAGALHALKLEGRALVAAYPPNEVSDDVLWHAVIDACDAFEARVLDWLKRPPQTNEVRRSAVILPALALLQARFGLPVELLELGTSGGLNLRTDRFRLETPHGAIGPADAHVVLEPDWQGSLSETSLPSVVRRAGVDLTPLDPFKPEDRLRLLAYLWADQPDRIERTTAAFEEAAKHPADIAAGDAADWLETQLTEPASDRLRVVFHTIAWQYFPDDTSARAIAAMRAAKGPLVRLSMEADGGKGAAVTLTTYPDEHIEPLGRADFHGRWVEWK